MKIAVISDIHNYIWNLHKALVMSELQATEAMPCCGDICSQLVYIYWEGRIPDRPIL